MRRKSRQEAESLGLLRSSMSGRDCWVVGSGLDIVGEFGRSHEVGEWEVIALASAVNLKWHKRYSGNALLGGLLLGEVKDVTWGSERAENALTSPRVVSVVPFTFEQSQQTNTICSRE